MYANHHTPQLTKPLTQSAMHSQLLCTLQSYVTGVRYHKLLFALTSFRNVTAFQTSVHPIFSPFRYTHAKTVTASSEQSCNHALTWCTRSGGQGVNDGQQVPGQFQAMVEVVVYAAQLESQQQLPITLSEARSSSSTAPRKVTNSNSSGCMHYCWFKKEAVPYT